MFDEAKYHKKYNKENYERIQVLVPKGAKPDLIAYAEANDLSLSSLVCKAVERQYHFDFDAYRKQNNET